MGTGSAWRTSKSECPRQKAFLEAGPARGSWLRRCVGISGGPFLLNQPGMGWQSTRRKVIEALCLSVGAQQDRKGYVNRSWYASCSKYPSRGGVEPCNQCIKRTQTVTCRDAFGSETGLGPRIRWGDLQSKDCYIGAIRQRLWAVVNNRLQLSGSAEHTPCGPVGT